MMRLKGDIPPIGSMIMTVVVVVVAIAILMTQVLKIDIAGFLQKKFGVEELPTSGYALHVRLDTVSSDLIDQKVKVYDFHLTDNTRHPACDGECKGAEFGPVANNPSSAFDFYVDKYNLGQCAIFTTNDYQTGSDAGRIYYVSSGSKVQDGQNSIKAGITILSGNGQNECNLVSLQKDGYVCGGNNCKKLIKRSGFGGIGTYDSPYSCAGKFNLVACGSSSAVNFLCEVPPTGDLGSKNKMVIDSQFTNQILQGDNWGCTSSCNLLVDKQYEVKYGIICGNDAKWHTCSDKNVDPLAGVTCQSGNNVFTWNGKLITGKLSDKYGFVTTPSVTNSMPIDLSYSGDNINSITLDLSKLQSSDLKNQCFFAGSQEQVKTFARNDLANPTNGAITYSVECHASGTYTFEATITDTNAHSLVLTNQVVVTTQVYTRN